MNINTDLEWPCRSN